jgi:hypothetical protein
MTDMGILRVEVLGAKDLMAGDRSGKSDVSIVIKTRFSELTVSLTSHSI